MSRFRGVMTGIAVCLALFPAPTPALTPVPVSATIFFARDSAELTEAMRRDLVGVASYIHYGRSNGHASCTSVRVSGHLDQAEAKAGNRGRVDLKRATAVRDFLRGLELLSAQTFDVFSYGADKPALANAPDDDAKNRRVDINWQCAGAQ